MLSLLVALALGPVSSVSARSPIQVTPTPALSLHGAWAGKTGPLRGASVVFEADGTCTWEGLAGTWTTSADGADLTVHWPAKTWECPVNLTAKRLVLAVEGGRSILRRSRSKPGGAVAAAHGVELAGSFSGSGVRLVLKDAAPGLVGTLALAADSGLASEMACRAVFHDGRAYCAVRPAGAAADSVYVFRRDGDAGFLLEGAAGAFRLSREGGLGGGLSGGSERAAPAAGARYRDPSGYYSFALPEGWTVKPMTTTEILINPGFSPTDSLDALIVLSMGEVPPEDAGRTPAEMLDRGQSQLRREWRSEGVDLQRAASKAQARRVGSLPAATMEWKGKLRDGQPIDAWMGGLAKGGGYLTVSTVVTSSRTQEFLPRIQGLFESVDFTPPKRERALERQLVGSKLQLTDHSGGNYMVTGIELHAGGVATEFTSMGGTLGLGSAGASYDAEGTYVVIGTTLCLTLDGKASEIPLTVRNGRITGVDRAQSGYRFSR